MITRWWTLGLYNMPTYVMFVLSYIILIPLVVLVFKAKIEVRTGITSRLSTFIDSSFFVIQAEQSASKKRKWASAMRVLLYFTWFLTTTPLTSV